MNTITMKDLRAKLDTLAPGEVILDVRTPEEYRSGHVPGAKNIPLSDLPAHLPEIGAYKHVYVHCQMGGRAGKAAAYLLTSGLNRVTCVSGSGMAEWISLGFPIEKT